VIGYDTIEYASLTDVGVRRGHNQDAHATLLASDAKQWQERGHIFIVADGMGAHAVGELASEMSVSIIPHTYHKYALQGGVSALRKAFIEANASIHAKGQGNPEFVGMGTTTTALLLRPEGAWIAHVGDSRAYRVRDGQIEQMSFDHSLVWEMAKRQGVSPELLEGIPTNVIVRSLGPEALVQVDVEGPHPIQGGDIFLLCSDGLSGLVADAEIGAIARALPPAEACRFLVDLANLRGGPDNITVLIVRVREQQSGVTANKPKRKAQLPRIPWPMATLVGGLAMAGCAVLLKNFSASDFLVLMAFVLATGAILTGLIGMIVHYNQESQRPPEEPAPGKPHIYRQSACPVDQALVDKVAKAIVALRNQLKERQWEADWTGVEVQSEHAQRILTQGKLQESFSEYCRGMRLLTEALQRQRAKTDSFAGVWDKG
jgi:protein phosphatase